MISKLSIQWQQSIDWSTAKQLKSKSIHRNLMSPKSQMLLLLGTRKESFDNLAQTFMQSLFVFSYITVAITPEDRQKESQLLKLLLAYSLVNLFNNS